jgi:hypothetical protein
MLLPTILTLFTFALQQPAPVTVPTPQLLAAARKLALDEGWHIDQKGYTLDPMQPATQDDFYNIGLYRDAHLLRMYSIHRRSGDIVDFMHGCDLLQFDDVKDLQSHIREASGASSIPPEKLAAQVGCPKLNLITTRWVR